MKIKRVVKSNFICFLFCLLHPPLLRLLLQRSTVLENWQKMSHFLTQIFQFFVLIFVQIFIFCSLCNAVKWEFSWWFSDTVISPSEHRSWKGSKGKKMQRGFHFCFCLLGNSPISLAPDMEIPLDLTHLWPRKMWLMMEVVIHTFFIPEFHDPCGFVSLHFKIPV